METQRGLELADKRVCRSARGFARGARQSVPRIDLTPCRGSERHQLICLGHLSV